MVGGGTHRHTLTASPPWCADRTLESAWPGRAALHGQDMWETAGLCKTVWDVEDLMRIMNKRIPSPCEKRAAISN